MRRAFHLLSFGLVVAVMLGASAIAPAYGTGRPEQIPAPLPGGPQPTITLSAGQGHAGEAITVSGASVASAPGVRVAWLTGDSTRTAAVVAREASNAYSASIVVPADAEPGSAQVCAAVTGTAQAVFACAPFTITPPPPGRVAGQIDFTAPASTAAVQQTINASFNLYSRTGRLVASAPIASDGSYQIDAVAPGTYDAAIVGVLPVVVAVAGPVIVLPGGNVAPPVGPVYVDREFTDPVSGQVCMSSQATAATVTADKNGPPYNATYSFGSYVALGAGGTAVNVTFDAALLQADGTAVERLEFHIQKPDKSLVALGDAASAPYQASYNMSLLPPGLSRLIVAPVVNGVRQCPTSRFIEVIADPMKDSLVRAGSTTTWDESAQHYAFKGTIPQLTHLPLTYPDPPPNLPLIGTIENTLDANLHIEGTLELDGDVRLSLLHVEALAKLLSREVYKRGKNLPTSDKIVLQSDDLRHSRVEFGPYKLGDFSQSIRKEGVLASYWGIVTVNAAVAFGINGDLTLVGNIKPLLPAVNTTLTPSVNAAISVSIWVDILLGVASGGAEATPQIGVKLPLRLNTEARPPVSLDQPCLQITVKLRAWADVLWKDYETSTTPVNYSKPADCGAANQSLTRQAPAAPPRVMAAPTVASGPSARMLAVYVADATPDAAVPTTQIVARFWDAQADAWGTPAPLTNGTRAVHDPAVAFVGPDGAALVVWTENTITPAESAAFANDLAGALRRNELFYATWNGAAWSAPQQLTDDTLPDGRAALSGDSSGATLAWVRDLDGDISTRTDWRIAVRDWSMAQQQWKAMELLNAPNVDSPSNNAQVSVFRGSGGTTLAWTNDADGDLTTNEDRRIAVAGYDSVDNVWRISVPADLPSGADSPTIVRVPFDPATDINTLLTFVVRGEDAGGVAIAIGNQGTLWTANGTNAGIWTANQLLDGRAPVYAERPRLDVSAQGEALLLFRRFGDGTTNAALGQLALSRRAPKGGSFASPLYLTNAPTQRWQQAFAINQNTEQAVVLDVSRAAVGTGAVATTQMHQPVLPALRSTMLTTAEEPVHSLLVAPTADPALDPELVLSQQHAVPGTAVKITAVARNLGRETVGNATVNFFSGTPGSGALIASQSLPAPLAFNQSAVVEATITAAGGEQPIYAQIETSGGNSSAANDQATAVMGAIPAPTLVAATISSRDANALDLTWLPPEMSGVAGYRILRATQAGGPYELVGEATSTSYSDLLLARGQAYHYVVQSYDAAGVVSVYSAEVTADVPDLQLYLPLMQQRNEGLDLSLLMNPVRLPPVLSGASGSQK